MAELAHAGVGQARPRAFVALGVSAAAAPFEVAAALPRALPVATKCTDCNARRAGVCDAVPEPELERLSAAAVAIRIAPGERFIEEGEIAGAFFALIDGTAKLHKMLPDGRQQITSFAGRGDFLGLAVEEHYSYSAEALDEVRLCRFSRLRLHRLIADFPAMEKRLLEITSHELVLAQEQMLLLGRKQARERLASFLVARVARAGPGRARGRPVEAAALPVPLPMTRSDIADYLGLSIETVSRTLTHLKVAGLIEAAPAAGIVIRDYAGLAALAAGI